MVRGLQLISDSAHALCCSDPESTSDSNTSSSKETENQNDLVPSHSPSPETNSWDNTSQE
ncbi:hypothetical protein NUACC21_49990 [Scytonema sp. NUACC21]